MKPKAIRAEARERAAAIIAKIRQSPDPTPAVVPLSQYPTQADFDAILGVGAGWSFKEYTAVNQWVCSELLAEGFEVVFVPIEAGEYFPWLHCYGVPNTPEVRAQYVGLKRLGLLYDTPPRHPRSN